MALTSQVKQELKDKANKVISFLQKYPKAPSYIKKAFIGGSLGPGVEQAFDAFGKAMQSGVSPQEAMSQLPFSAQRQLPGGYEAKAAMDQNLSQMMQREAGGQAGALSLGAQVPTSAGLGIIGMAAVDAGFVLDEAIRKQYGTGLPEAAKTILKSPRKGLQQAGKGVGFLAENLTPEAHAQMMQPGVPTQTPPPQPTYSAPEPTSVPQVQAQQLAPTGESEEERRQRVQEEFRKREEERRQNPPKVPAKQPKQPVKPKEPPKDLDKIKGHPTDEQIDHIGKQIDDLRKKGKKDREIIAILRQRGYTEKLLNFWWGYSQKQQASIGQGDKAKITPPLKEKERQDKEEQQRKKQAKNTPLPKPKNV